jgi:hypothetical protein
MSQTQMTLADSNGVETLELNRTRTSSLLTDVSRPADSLTVRVGSIFLLAVFACVAVWHGWQKGYVLAPTDLLKTVAPWQTPGGNDIGANENLLDQTVQFVPWTIYTIERYKQGQIPLWNPNSQLGVPFLGNGQSAIFYPTILLHWHLPETWSWTISAALRLFLAGLGVYLLAGRYGARGVGRLLSAVAFMLCGFNVVWLNHPQMNVMPLLPWALLMTEMLVERVALHRMLGAGLVFFVQFLGGHPASCIHLVLACLLVWGLRVFVVRGRAPRAGRLNLGVRSGIALGGAIGLGFLMAAAQWLPLIEYAHNSGAALVRQDNLKHAGWIAFDPRYLIGAVFPYANGFPDGVAPFELRRQTHLPNTNELAPAFIGIIPLLLALFAAVVLRRQRVVRMWTIIALVSAAIAVKFPGVDHVVRLIPGLNVAQNARLLVVTALALAILAGLGLGAMVEMMRAGIDLPRLRKGLIWTACSIAGIAVIAALVLMLAKNPILKKGYAAVEAERAKNDSHEHSAEYAKEMVGRVHKELLWTSYRLLIPAGMLGLAALMLWHSSRKRGGGIAASPWPWFGLAAVDLLGFAIPYNPGSPVDTYFPGNVAMQKLSELPPNRLAGTFHTLLPETSTAYGLADLRGYDALAPQRYYKWWKHPGIGDLPASAQGYLSRLDNFEDSAWGLLNFGYLVTGPDQPAPPVDKFKPMDSGDDARIYQATTIRPRAWVAAKAEVFDTIDPVLDRVAKMDFNPDEVVLLDKDVARDQRELAAADKNVWEHAALGAGRLQKPTVEILPATKKEDERPEILRVRVSGARGGYLVLADTYFPGWSATISDGSAGVKDVPILPAYGVMRAVPLPAGGGATTVEFRYRPWSWRIGAALSLGAILLFLLLAGLSMIPRSADKSEGAV